MPFRAIQALEIVLKTAFANKVGVQVSVDVLYILARHMYYGNLCKSCLPTTIY